MPMVSSLKSSRTREKKTLIREETEAQKLLQAECGDGLQETLKYLMSVGKVLMNLETKLGRLELANEKLSEAYEQNEDQEGAVQFQSTLDEEAELIDGVLSRISELKILKGELERKRNEIEKAQSHMSSSSETHQTDHTLLNPTGPEIASIWSPSVQGPIKPPHLEIASFDGNILKWREFWDQFEAAIHNAKFSSIDKMNYLRSRLTGEALDAISGYQLSNDNYKVVVDVLKRRFGNPQLIIDAHYRNLSHLPVATNNTGSLRQTYDAIERSLRSLEALGENVDHRHFVAMISEKLPQKVMYQLYMLKPDGDEWTVSKLRQLLEKHITALEMAGGDPRPNQSLVKPHNKYPPRDGSWQLFNPKSTAGGLLAGGNKSFVLSKQNPKCIYCGQSHWSDECTKFATLQSRKEKLKNSCFKCLQRGHTQKDCRRSRPCAHCGRLNHHRSLCSKLFGGVDQPSNRPRESPSIDQTEVQTVSGVNEEENMMLTSSNQVLMQTALSTVKNISGNTSLTVRIILDSGSQRTYITEKLAKELNLHLKPLEKLAVVTFGTEKPRFLEYKPSTLQLMLKDGKAMNLDVSVVPSITGKINRFPLKAQHVEFFNSKFGKNMLADSLPKYPESSKIDMLIGNDCYFDLLEPQKLDVGGGLFLFNSKLGWILGGQTESTMSENSTESHFLVGTIGTVSVGDMTSVSTLNNTDVLSSSKPNLESFWSLEAIGITDSPRTCDDDQALENFQKTVRYENNRYFVTWPWKEPNPSLPQNYQLAAGRLKFILSRLQKDPQLLRSYAAVIQEQLDRGIIEVVTNESVEGPYKHYIPHHAVVTPSKNTTKVRVVYDASAKTRQTNNSLNECLYRGPVILPDLCGLLLRFRLSPIAVVGDIEKAFLSIGLQATDRDVTRFLWLKDPTVTNVENNVQIYRFCRVPFGVISSPFLLAATISYHLQQSDNQFAEVLKRDIYVDNVITGVNTVEEAKALYSGAKSLFRTASMNLWEWASNSQQFMEFIPPADKAANSEQKILGIKWNLSNDTLSVPGSSADKIENISTKREVLQMTASIFDPLGFFAPIVLKAKLFLKKLWNERLDWDDKLSDEYLKEWTEISKQLGNIPLYNLSRFIGVTGEMSSAVEYKLVCFCDASGVAYATTIYLHQSSDGNCRSDLIFSKTRLAPSETTIPRLELLAVLIGVRALKFVGRELHLTISSFVLFTDSTCVLHWLKTSKPLSVFVTNRVKEIKSLPGVTFAHVPTSDNPADMATRGMSPEELLSSIWWKGPVWLTNPVQQWPDSEHIDEHTHEFESEVRGSKTFYEAKLVCGEALPGEFSEIRPNLSDIDERRYGSLFKLFRVTAWVFRFISKLKKERNLTGPITTPEIQKTKVLWELYIQQKHYTDTVQKVKQGKKSNLQNQLNLKSDESGLLRCHGRFENAELTQAAKHPKLLPKDDYFTRLVVEDAHSRVLHSGVSQTLARVRKEYWIPHGRAVVKKIIKECRVCKRVEGTPFAMPNMPNLPRERVAKSHPFEYTGIDYFGPLYVKDYKQVDDQPAEQIVKKVWVCLFTCFTVRAIHLELVEDMSCEEFLLGLRRFIARRGTPRQILSDNAKQFKAAQTVLGRAWRDVVNDAGVCEFATYQGIQWKFIVELAPWMGGFYERLVGLTKRALRKTIGTKCLSQRQLATVLTEAEAVLNSRPLVYVEDDINSSVALTPMDFLSLHSQHVIPDLTDETDPEVSFTKKGSTEQLLQIWKCGQKHLNQFWKIWRNEYLSNLRERHQRLLKSPRSTIASTPKVGDIVVIKEDLPRGKWKIGRVCELIPSRDQVIRSAKVTIAPRKFIKRAINFLYPIECPDQSVHDLEDNLDGNQSSNNQSGSEEMISNNDDDDDVQRDDNDESPERQDDVMCTTRPTRKAVIKARQRIQQWLSPEEASLGSVAARATR